MEGKSTNLHPLEHGKVISSYEWYEEKVDIGKVSGMDAVDFWSCCCGSTEIHLFRAEWSKRCARSPCLYLLLSRHFTDAPSVASVCV